MKILSISFCFAFLCFQMIAQGQNSNNENKDWMGRSPADTNRIDKFRNNHVDLTGSQLADASFPKSWPIPGLKGRLSIGGYVKLDYIQDFNGVHNDRYELASANVHVDGSGIPKELGYMNMFARESRFHFDFRKIAENGKPLRIFLEMDFWNLDRDPFHNVPRLRHFYAVYNNWIIGRTWGTLTDVYSVPFTLDFEAGDAVSGSRRAVIRYESEINSSMKWAAGLEMLDFPDIDGNGYDGKASQSLPLFAARITKQTKLDGRMMFGGSIYQLRWDGLESGPNASAIGWGLLFSGRQNFSEKIGLLWNASAGDGWGGNVLALLGNGNSAILTPEGNLETMFAWNLGLALAYTISPVMVVNLQAGWIDLDLSEYKGNNSYQSGGTGHINLIYSPAKSVNVGIEYQIAQRKNKDGKSGIANRIQAMGKYIF